ncbi:MAG: hypothetical protein QW123_00120 [Desulfurococcaceae archaeon]
MGRRRKRRKTIVKRVVKIPIVFDCPNCASKSLTITIKKSGDKASALVSCSSCGLLDDEDFAEIPVFYETVDVYAKFLDLYSSGQAKVKTLK